MKTIAASHLFETYDAVLLDAYGVLVDAQGVLPHAVAFIEALKKRAKPFFIVTNDASRLPQSIAQRFAKLGLPIAAEQIVTSGGLLTNHYEKANLHQASTLLVGSDDAMTYVREAGGVPKRPLGAVHPDARVVVICDATGSEAVSDIECVIDTVVARRDRGEDIDLILCNPDLIYPRSPGRFGLTSGAMMALVEASLKTRLHPAVMPTITRLGKPYPEIFAEAARRAGPGRLALVGDQLGTDILGATRFGIDAVLVGTGLTQVNDGVQLQPEPTYFLPDLRL